MLKLSVVLSQCKVLAERPLIAQVAQAVETSMSGATDQNPPPICSQLSQRPRNETPLPKNSQRCKGGFDSGWSAHWALRLLGFPSPEEVQVAALTGMRFYRLYGADGNCMALPASCDISAHLQVGKVNNG